MNRLKNFEQLVARGNTMQLVDYVKDNETAFKSLMDTYIHGPYRITQSVAAAVTEISISKGSMLRPHWRRMIKALNDPGASVALKRNTIRLMQFVTVPAQHRGSVLDLCFRFLQDKSETIAVKVFSLSVAELLTRDAEELRRELTIVIEDQLPYSGPAFHSRASKVLKALRLSARAGRR